MLNTRQLALLAAMLSLLGAGCSKEKTGASQLQPAASPEDSGHMRMTAEEYAETLPVVGGPEGYTGSESCKTCHEDQFTSWHRSYHRTMTQFADGAAVKARFNGVVLTNEGTRFLLSETNGQHWVRMEKIDAPDDSVEVRLGLVTGSHHMQVFWVPEGHGNMQIGFPFSWLIPEQRWVPRNATFIRPPDMPHLAEAWNIVCSRCHTTGVEPHANLAERTIETRVAELGISCEACHGPGQKHVQVQTAALQAPGPKTVAPGEIIHPKEIDPVRGSQICGFCHSMKWIAPEENWRESGFRFRPGDDLEKTTPVIRPALAASIPALEAYLNRNPEILDDFFWPDGMIRVSGREYNGLIESPCYKGGKFSCMSCHSLHESDPDDQLAARARGNGACIQCHEDFNDSARLIAHTRHRANSAGSECYNCHMPHTTYGVLKGIRSHQISSPNAAEVYATGRLNACNFCHMDKPLAWTARHLNEWFGQAVPEMKGGATNIAAVVNLALTGDAGQRVLSAWHLSWPPALEASGKEWVPAVLAQLLDDPYAAVRCVAERSLRKMSNLVPPDYDYTVDPRTRNLVREEIWRKWQTQGAPKLTEEQAAFLLISPADLGVQRNAFEQRLLLRNSSPVRLRE